MISPERRGAITTVDRVQHVLATQLEADFCLPAGSIASAIAQQKAGENPTLAAVQLPAESMGASRRRGADIWELRVGNYNGVGVLCARHPRVLEAAREYLAGDQSNWLGDYAQLRQLNELLTPYSQQLSGTSVYYTPSRALVESVVPAELPAQEVKCAVPGIGMMRRVDSAALRSALADEISGERVIAGVANASAGAIEVEASDLQAPELRVHLEFLNAEQFERFRGDVRYANALGFSEKRPDVQVLAAYEPQEFAQRGFEADPIAMAGASDDSPIMRQIGVDVLPAYRNHHLASVLVRELARAVLAAGFVPFYGTSPSHVLSQRVAFAAGLVPTWWEYVSTSLLDIDMN